MQYQIKREFIETYIVEAKSLAEALKQVDDCDVEPIEVIYGDLLEAEEV